MKQCDFIKKLYIFIDKIVRTQDNLTKKWHTNIDFSISDKKTIIQNITNNHFMNFKLWHAEDIARIPDAPAKSIAQCKREIDLLNKKRTEFYEQIDENFVFLLKDFIVANLSVPFNTESVGSIIDRLSILSLKIYHMYEEKRRRTSNDSDYQIITDKLRTLIQQRKDLISAFKNLISEYINGTKRPIIYKQLKMYNDKNLNPALYNESLSQP